MSAPREPHDVVYRSDRGDRFKVTTMETSHLINVISHHRTQIETLRALGMLKATQVLEDVIAVLTKELRTRNLSAEDYFQIMEVKHEGR